MLDMIEEEFSVSGSIINGTEDRAGLLVDVVNPATGRAISKLSLAGEPTVMAAVDAARKAFPAWAAVAPAQRARYLLRFLEILNRDKQDLAEIVTREHGKPIADALGSIQRGIEVVEFAIGAPHLLKGENADHVATGISTRSARKPLGVCLGITPYNYPVMIPLWMFPISLVCGNTFILKPSESVPGAANRLAEMLREAGVPDGVFNVVHGDKTAAEALIKHPDIAAVSFVGSTAAARAVYRLATHEGKRAQALGGAKNHAIIMPDADMNLVVDATLNGAFNSAGQRCMAIAVAVCVGDAYDRYMPLLLERARALHVSAGTDPKCFVPPISNARQYGHVLQHIARAVEEGARLSLDGRRNDKSGYLVGPTIVEDVNTSMSIYRDEVFGPVLAVLKADSLQDAITLTNNHELANGAVLFTASGADAAKFERNILCGMPGVNVPVPSPVAYFSFGGNKNSFNGDLAMHGPDSINFYTRRQVLTTRWP